ncbi:MAG: hypothetical protein ACK46X_09370 [Candidatus Sericytochromatia bacterium]
MQFPLTLRFKIFSLTSEIYVTEPNGNVVWYVKQKLLKLKEDITIFGDEQQREKRYTIKADRVIDFSAKYHFKDAHGVELGAIKRKGMRSFWKAHYEIYDAHDHLAMTLSEENPWVKVLDGLVGEIPVVGFLVGYVLNPTYMVSQTDGTPVVRLKKVPSLLERRFEIEKLSNVAEAAQDRALLGVLMMVLLERSRG